MYRRQEYPTWVYVVGLALLAVVLVVVIALVTGAANRHKVENAPQRVTELATLCQTAVADLARNQQNVQEQWSRRKANLAPGRLVGDLSFDPRNAQTISIVCSRVSDLQSRVRRAGDLPQDKRDGELIAVYDAADVDGVRNAVNSANFSSSEAELAISAVKYAENRLSSVQYTVDNAPWDAVDEGGARGELASARSEVASGWSYIAGSSWALAQSTASSAESYMNSAVKKASPPPTATPIPTATSEPTNTPVPDEPELRPTIDFGSSDEDEGPELRPTP